MNNGIGWAIEEMQHGGHVARAGWNGKGMWIGVAAERGEMTEPFVFLKTAQGARIPWNASQADLLAIDWELANEPSV